MKKITTHSADETKKCAAEFVSEIKPGVCIALQGDLGSGKTTFVQGMLETLGAPTPYVSPTFVIMKEYAIPSSHQGIARIYHVDAYRINAPEELERLGFAEWCADPEGIVILEWPERVMALLPASIRRLLFSWVSDTDREITL